MKIITILTILVLALGLGTVITKVGNAQPSNTDSDNDGVGNLDEAGNPLDQCPDTSPFFMVDKDGCPIRLQPPQGCSNSDGDAALPWSCARRLPLYCNGNYAPPKFESNCALCGCDAGNACDGNSGTCSVEEAPTSNGVPTSTSSPSLTSSGDTSTTPTPSTTPMPPTNSQDATTQSSIGATQQAETQSGTQIQYSYAEWNVPSNLPGCYDYGGESECENENCYWDTSYIDECKAFCSELSDSDCQEYDTCLLMETGSSRDPEICVDPYQLQHEIHSSFPEALGELDEGQQEILLLNIPDIAIARRDPDITCPPPYDSPDYTIEWTCAKDSHLLSVGPPTIQIKITAKADHQCEGDEIVRFSLGCAYGLCTTPTPQTHTLIIHDNTEDCR